MEPVVIACGGCGKAIRIRHPEVARRRVCPSCQTILVCPSLSAQTRDRALAAHAIAAEPADASFLEAPSAVCRLLRLLSPPLGVTLAAFSLLVVWCCWSSPNLAARWAANGVEASVSAARPGAVPTGSREPEPGSRLEADPAPSKEERAVPAVIPFPPFDGPVLAVRDAVEVEREEAGARTELPHDPGHSRPDVASPLPSPPAVTPVSIDPAEQQFRIRDETGRPVVARLHGQRDGQTVLILPDGQLGIPTMLCPTNEPFQPLTAEELLPRLREGPLGEFQVLRTSHYLIFYRSTDEFAEASGRLLEDLYKRLLDAFRKHAMPVHEAEFPLVAVIYRTEADFRASKRVDPEIQAFYEIFTNRIYFYESSERDEHAPEVTALRKPQTVAHEGTHQILQNIGVHPRLSAWPIWLVEGLAEYCATPSSGRRGRPTWDGLGMINGLHMATIRELEDPLSIALHGQDSRGKDLLREPGKPLVESLIRKPRLTPTEYALAWAMTHYLASKRGDDFIDYLRSMSRIPPLEPRTPEDHLAEFRKAFGQDLARVDKAIDAYLRKLARQKNYDPMPYYAVTFFQPLPAGLLHRTGMVSQSPQMIQQWIQENIDPQGGQANWQVLPHSTHARAVAALEVWWRGD
jgi:hypothetical protein